LKLNLEKLIKMKELIFNGSRKTLIIDYTLLEKEICCFFKRRKICFSFQRKIDFCT